MANRTAFLRIELVTLVSGMREVDLGEADIGADLLTCGELMDMGFVGAGTDLITSTMKSICFHVRWRETGAYTAYGTPVGFLAVLL